MDCPFANDRLDGFTSCKWSSGRIGFLQMIIWMDLPLANDHMDGPASCRWSSGWIGFLQMIIWMDWPLAHNHPDGLASCKRSSFSVFFTSARNISYISKYLPFFPSLFFFAINIFSLSKYFLLFHHCYSSPPQKNTFSFSNNFPHFPSLLFSPPQKYIFLLQIKSSISISTNNNKGHTLINNKQWPTTNNNKHSMIRQHCCLNMCRVDKYCNWQQNQFSRRARIC